MERIKFEYGVDERGCRKVIVKYKGKYFIFREISKLLKFLNENNANRNQIERALKHVNKIFRKLEKEYPKYVFEKILKNKKINYVG